MVTVSTGITTQPVLNREQDGAGAIVSWTNWLHSTDAKKFITIDTMDKEA